MSAASGRRLAAFVAVFVLGLVLGGLAVHLWQRPHTGGGEPPRRWEATVFLPLNDNDGKLITAEEWQAALALFVREFGGATLGEVVEGYYDDGGKVQHERMRPVIVSFEPHRLDDFRRTLDAVGRRLGQKEMYTRFERPHVELRRVPGS
jgi:hypothetical protein